MRRGGGDPACLFANLLYRDDPQPEEWASSPTPPPSSCDIPATSLSRGSTQQCAARCVCKIKPVQRGRCQRQHRDPDFVASARAM